MRDTFLRAPAAFVAAAVLFVTVIGDFLFPDQTAVGNLAVAYGLLAACALPFLIPWSWAANGPRSRVLLAWLCIGALIVTARLAYLVAWLFPRRPIDIWAGMSLAFLVIVAALWLAVWAAWRRIGVPSPARPLRPTSGR